MRTIPFNTDTGTWVRLVYKGAIIGVDRWPGEHRPGSVIHTSGGGDFVFDHLHPSAASDPEAVYIWAPTS
jgi:hypothetical protein